MTVQNREQPWSRRPDWAAGRIEYSSKGGMVGVWLMALLVLLMSSPLVYHLREEILEKENYPALAGLVFPVLGIGLLIQAIRLTIRWLRFGKSVLELSRVPGVIGGSVAGIIHTSLKRETVGGVRVSLRSINRSVRRKHRKRDVRERIVWEEHLPISRERLSVGMLGVAVPFSFRVPFECQDTTDEDSDNRILWILTLTASVPGVDYQAEFELPVFRTEESSPEPVPSPSQRSPDPNELGNHVARSKIRVRTTPVGGKELYFPAGRNPSAAASLTVFFLIWVGAIWFQVHLGAPMFFPIVFSIFGALILWFVLDLWFGSTRVVIDADEVRVKNAIFGLGSTRRYLPSEFADVKKKIGMQSGGRNGTAYYQIRLVRNSGREVVAGEQVRDKREAERLVQEIKTSLGL